jgi:hypothetical protein
VANIAFDASIRNLLDASIRSLLATLVNVLLRVNNQVGMVNGLSHLSQ